MTHDMDLKTLERTAYLSYHRDGIPDIILGICLILFGIEMAMEMFVFTVFFPLFIIGTGYYARKLITVPRLGFARFSDTRKRIERRKTVFMASFGGMVFGAFCAIYFIRGGTFAILQTYPLLILAIIWGIFPVFGGLLLGAKRMYAYAVLIAVVFVPGQALYSYEPGRVIIAGAAVFAAGMLVLARFMRKNPRAEGDAT